jgi:hypothetical protein
MQMYLPYSSLDIVNWVVHDKGDCFIGYVNFCYGSNFFGCRKFRYKYDISGQNQTLLRKETVEDTNFAGKEVACKYYYGE